MPRPVVLVPSRFLVERRREWDDGYETLISSVWLMPGVIPIFSVDFIHFPKASLRFAAGK